MYHGEALDTGSTLDETPPEWIPEPVAWGDTLGDRFFDNVAGFELNLAGVGQARIEEMVLELDRGLQRSCGRDGATANFCLVGRHDHGR